MRVGGAGFRTYWLVIVVGLLLAGRPAQAFDLKLTDQQSPRNPDDVASLFAGCLVKGGDEVLVTPESWRCVPKLEGAHYFKSHARELGPQAFDPTVVCGQQSGNRRQMPTGLIQALIKKLRTSDNRPAVTTDQRIAIRIIGGAYCRDELDLSNLDIPYPLVLDYSLFRFGIRADKFHTTGYFSIDNSYIFDNLAITDNSRFGGSFFARHAFIEGLRVIDADIGGDIDLRHSLLAKYSTFDRVKVLGGLNAAQSALSSFIVLNSKVGDRLSLNESEAQCRYEVRNSTFGEIFAAAGGFGAVAAADKPTSRTWNENLRNKLAAIFANPAVKKAVGESQNCITPDAEMTLIDDNMRAVCLRDFHWLTAPGDAAPPRTLVTIDDLTVSRDLNLDLWNGGSAYPTPDRRVLQIVGTKTDTLIFDFGDTDDGYHLYVDRLQVNRLQDGDIACGQETGVQNYNLPTTYRVTKWLQRNMAPTTEPFLTFANAFERSGADSTDLKVAKASADFYSDLAAKWAEFTAVTTSGKPYDILTYLFSTERVFDVIRLSINAIVGYVSDFGYRPYKSILVVILLIWAFNYVICRRMKVSHAVSEVQGKRFNLGPFFFFDYMIPMYSIDPAHAKIKEFYFANDAPLDEATRRRLDRLLWWMRIVGLGAVVFLSATLKASVVS